MFLAVLFVAAAPTLRTRFQRLFGRLAYGTGHNPEALLNYFASRIPTAADRDTLVSLLADEITPSLMISQSALCMVNETRPALMYERGVTSDCERVDFGELLAMMENAGQYRPPDPKAEGHFAWVRLAILLKVRDTTTGVWLFGRRDPDDFYPRMDIELLEGLANQVAIAIENTRLYTTSQRQTQELTGLYQVALATGSALDRETLLNRLYEQVRDLIPMDTFVVALRDAEAETFEVIYAMEEGEPVEGSIGLELPLSDGGLTGWILREGEPLIIGDLESQEGPVEPVHGDRPARAWLGVPLLAHERTIGVISVQSFESHAFDSEDARFMEALARQLAIAIENVDLFEETRRRAAQQEALNAIISDAATLVNLPKLLGTALDRLLRALSLEMGAVWLEEPAVFQGRGLPLDHPPRDIQRTLDWIEMSGLREVQDWRKVDEPTPDEVNVAPRELGLRASLTVPVLSEELRIGGLVLLCENPREWSEAEVALVEAVGRQLGGALERMRLLEQIQQQARQMVRILDTVQEGIFTLDQERKVKVANPTARAFLKVLADGDQHEEITHLGGRPIGVFLQPRADGLPHEIRVDDAGQRVFEVLATPIQDESEKEGWTVLVREMTETRKAQDRAYLQDRLAAVGQLAAGIAHDFNNILVAIILFSEILQKEPELTDKGKERISVIIQQAQRAATLTRQVLDFSRQSIMDLHPLNLVPFLKEFTKLLERTLPESIRLKLVNEGEELFVRADPTRIQQVFMNLALNARDAMKSGGELVIKVDSWQLGTADQPPFHGMPLGEWIRARVIDDGAGIPTEIQPHIFEPFFTTKEPGQGTGLGLAQVYGIVKQHNGYIEVTSRVGAGTTFTIYLPALAVPQLEPGTREEELVVSGDGQRILVVEDQEGPREAVCQMLESLNFTVLPARNGREALEIFSRERVDLVLSDMVMPEMGGVELFRELRERDTNLGMVLMTGYPLGTGTRELLDRERVAWVQKPLDAKTLALVIRDMLLTREGLP
jgi:signal transduction histidine kinase